MYNRGCLSCDSQTLLDAVRNLILVKDNTYTRAHNSLSPGWMAHISGGTSPLGAKK